MVAAAIVLECHTLVVREPGAAKNDLVAAALLLAAAAILVNALPRVSRGWRGGGGSRTARGLPAGPPPPRQDPRADALPGLNWAIAAAGLATGLAVGTKSTAVAMAAGPDPRSDRARARRTALGRLRLVVRPGPARRRLLVPAQPDRRRQSAAAGDEHRADLAAPSRSGCRKGGPDFSIVHYLTDTGVWRDYFEPGLHQAFGALWPLVIAAAVAGGLLALFRARDGVLRWMGAVALFGLLAYLFTPLSAAGAEGAPVGFGINIRYAIPALLLGLTLLPTALPPPTGRNVNSELTFRPVGGWFWGGLAALVLMLVATDRSDAVVRDPARLFAWGLAFLVVVVPAGLLSGPDTRGAARGWSSAGSPRSRCSSSRSATRCSATTLSTASSTTLRPKSASRALDLDSAYTWARDIGDARIGLAGTTAGFLQYGFYGTDLSNRVVYLGEKGPHGAYNAIPTCAAFRTAVNAADLDYLVTAPFLNFIDTSAPIPSPEANWLRGDPAVKPINRKRPGHRLEAQRQARPIGLRPANAPLRRIPNTPQSRSQ